VVSRRENSFGIVYRRACTPQGTRKGNLSTRKNKFVFWLAIVYALKA